MRQRPVAKGCLECEVQAYIAVSGNSDPSTKAACTLLEAFPGVTHLQTSRRGYALSTARDAKEHTRGWANHPCELSISMLCELAPSGERQAYSGVRLPAGSQAACAVLCQLACHRQARHRLQAYGTGVSAWVHHILISGRLSRRQVTLFILYICFPFCHVCHAVSSKTRFQHLLSRQSGRTLRRVGL